MDCLRFHFPSSEWMEGLPIGNGRIGLMAYGLAGQETFCVNADTLFRRKWEKRFDTAKLIPEIRRLIQENRGFEADRLFLDAIKDLPGPCNPYQPFMNLCVTTPRADAREYARTLNLETAVAEIAYRYGENDVAWKAFATAPDQLLVLTRSAREPVTQTIRLAREEDPECEVCVRWEGTRGIFNARFAEGVRFAAVADVKTDGQARASAGALTIANAKNLEIRIALSTQYEAEDASAACLRALESAREKTLERILADHISEYRALYGQMSLSLGEEDARDTDELYQNAMGAQPAPRLNAQIFAYARYLMVSSSRPGCLPVNLQGLWCKDLKPMWDCGYTTDMNIQMAYWMAEKANLSPCHMALFDWLNARLPAMEKLCKEIFGAEDAVYVPQYTDAFFTPTCWRDYGAFQVLWSGAAAWLARHYYEHWLYTNNEAFARTQAIPFMKRCASFYRQMLVKDEDGRYRMMPSCSPENFIGGDGIAGQLVDTATMDISLVHDLVRNLLALCEALGIEDPQADAWREMDANMARYPLDADGALLEWLDARAPGNPGHRHLSHLYGAFPADLFERDAAMMEAARKAIDRRLANGVGASATWSFAWYACLFARMGQGERALEFLDHIVHGGLLPNLLTTHNDWRGNRTYAHITDKKVFQIDALLGSAAAVCEMLARVRDGVIELLPALPERWKTRGSVRGLAMPGGVRLDFAWENGSVTRLRVRAPEGRALRVVFRGAEMHEMP